MSRSGPETSSSPQKNSTGTGSSVIGRRHYLAQSWPQDPVQAQAVLAQASAWPTGWVDLGSSRLEGSLRSYFALAQPGIRSPTFTAMLATARHPCSPKVTKAGPMAVPVAPVAERLGMAPFTARIAGKGLTNRQIAAARPAHPGQAPRMSLAASPRGKFKISFFPNGPWCLRRGPAQRTSVYSLRSSCRTSA